MKSCRVERLASVASTIKDLCTASMRSGDCDLRSSLRTRAETVVVPQLHSFFCAEDGTEMDRAVTELRVVQYVRSSDDVRLELQHFAWASLK